MGLLPVCPQKAGANPPEARTTNLPIRYANVGSLSPESVPNYAPRVIAQLRKRPFAFAEVDFPRHRSQTPTTQTSAHFRRSRSPGRRPKSSDAGFDIYQPTKLVALSTRTSGRRSLLGCWRRRFCENFARPNPVQGHGATEGRHRQFLSIQLLPTALGQLAGVERQGQAHFGAACRR